MCLEAIRKRETSMPFSASSTDALNSLVFFSRAPTFLSLGLLPLLRDQGRLLILFFARLFKVSLALLPRQPVVASWRKHVFPFPLIRT